MNALLLLLSVCIVDLDLPTEDTVVEIEVNHYYSDIGSLIYDQVIFWDCTADGQLYVVAYRLWHSEAQRPWRDGVREGYVTIWLDGDRLRIVRAISATESWTRYDPEITNRNVVGFYQRQGLRGERQLKLRTEP